MLILIVSLVVLLATVLRMAISALLALLRKELPCDPAYRPSVAVLISAYNEPFVYECIKSIAASTYPLEVLARDDYSPDGNATWNALLRAAHDFPNVRVARNTRNMGKSPTLCTASHETDAEIVISCDSDTIFAPDMVEKLVAVFSDERVGAAGAIVKLSNKDQNIFTACQAFVYAMSFAFQKTFETYVRAVTCIPGAAYAIRRKLLLEIEPAIKARNWFGVHITIGEDRFCTWQTLLRGYQTLIVPEAVCWTIAPSDFHTLYKQQLRWRKGSLLNYFSVLRQLPHHIRTLHFVAVLSMVLPSTFLLICLFGMLTNFDILSIMTPSAALLYAAAGGVFNLLAKPEDRLRNPFALAFLAAWGPINVLFLTVTALLTFADSGWGTRESK